MTRTSFKILKKITEFKYLKTKIIKGIFNVFELITFHYIMKMSNLEHAKDVSVGSI